MMLIAQALLQLLLHYQEVLAQPVRVNALVSSMDRLIKDKLIIEGNIVGL